MHTHYTRSAPQTGKLRALLFGVLILICIPAVPGHSREQTIHHYTPGNWGGIHGGTDSAILFQASGSQLTRLRIGNFILYCMGQGGKDYEWPVTLSQRQTDSFPFLIKENDRFDGGFTVDPNDFAYGGLEVNMQGQLQGNSGTVNVWMTIMQPDNVCCDGQIRFSVRKMP